MFRAHGSLPSFGTIPHGKDDPQTTHIKVKFIPTAAELESFAALQNHLCEQFILYHHIPHKQLFFKLDASKDAFGLVAFQLADDHWDGQ
jgi:hypothetical protein